MPSKYDEFCSTKQANILSALEEARETESGASLDMSDIQPLGDREYWDGKCEIVDGILTFSRNAHLTAIGRLLADNLPEWAQSGTVTATMDKGLNLHLSYSEGTEQREEFDIAARLQQWTDEATNPDNPHSGYGIRVYNDHFDYSVCKVNVLKIN